MAGPTYIVGIAPPTNLPGGTLIVASAATPQALVGTLMPCKFVWIGARMDATGAALNTQPAFVGDALNQNMPIPPDGFGGWVIDVDDASKLFVKVGVNGEGVAFRIFQ